MIPNDLSHAWEYSSEVFNYILISHPQICIKFKEFARLTSQRKTKVRQTGFYCPSNRNCQYAMKVYHWYFEGRMNFPWAAFMSKATYNVAQQNCLFLIKENVFSWLLTAYLNTYVSNRDANFQRKYGWKLSPFRLPSESFMYVYTPLV